MKQRILTLLSGLFLASLASGATLIVGDDYNVANTGSGFALNRGVNSLINPPTATRLTGTAAPGLRYIKAFGDKANNAHYITNSSSLGISRVSSDSSTLSLSQGTEEYDFGPILNTLAASPALPSVYECTIKIANGAAGTQRCSFSLGSSKGTATTWDFGIQLWRASTSDTAYTLQKRISTGASGGGTALNEPIGMVGTYPNSVEFLIRITDAGAESSTFNSRVQVSINGGATWIYDTSTDSNLPNGWRFPASSRFIYLDIAGGAGPVTFDDFTLNWISGPASGVRTWTGEGADGNWSTSANWGGMPPSTGDSPIFAGTMRQTNTNDITGLIVPWIAFSNGGFSLYGELLTISGAITNIAGTNTFGGDLAWDSTSSKTWNIAGGSEIILNNISSIGVLGDHVLLGGGTLRLKGTIIAESVNPAFIINEGKHVLDGGIFTSRGGYRIGSLASAATGALTLLTNGATLSLTTSGANLRVGDSANPVTSRLGIDNSTLSLSGGLLAVPYATGATAEVAQIGGTVTGGRVSFSDGGAGKGTYTLKNGTLGAFQIKKDTASGIASMYFDNALLQSLSGASNAFMTGLDVAEIQSGGLTIEAQTDVTIAQSFTGPGSLTNISGTTTLAGTNTYAGNTVVTGGKLVLTTGRTHPSPIRVADSAALGVLAQTPGTTLTNSALSLGFSTLSFDLGTLPNPTNAMLKVSTLSANNAVSIELRKTGAGLSTGRIVLVDYDGAIGGGFGNFVLGSLPDGVTATLINNTANSSIDLNITGVPGFRWTGAQGSAWDYSTENWINLLNGTPATYADGAPVEFRDGASTGLIDLAIYPSPSALVVSNNLLPYVWSEAAITTPILKKSGTNSLTRINGAADLIAEIELNDGSLILNSTYDVDLHSLLTDTSAGTGDLVKQSGTTLTLSAASPTYDGGIIVEAGILKLGVADALGSTNGSTSISNGATLELNNLIAPHEPIFVSGQGVGNLGAIVDSTTATGVANNLTDVTLLGNTTLGSPEGRWDIRVRSATGPGPGLKGNGYNLTKVGSGTLSIACQRHDYGAGVSVPYWNMNLGDVFINAGNLTFAESLTLGNPAKTITIAPGAILGTYDLNVTNPIMRTIMMTDATISSGGASNDTNVFNGSIQVTGTAHFRVNNDTRMIINGSIVGNGSLNVSADSAVGMLLLNGPNTFAGTTTVTNNILSGSGSLAGSLVMLGGTLAPGNGVGTLTVNGSVTLAGTTVMQVQSPASDRLVVGGALNLDGTLQIVLAGNPQPGDVYQLFSKAGVGTFDNIILPDISGLPGNMSWDTSSLYVNGSIKVNGSALPPTIGTVSLNSGAFTFSGTGGMEGATYYVVTSPDVTIPLSAWTPIATNVFGAGGSFSFSTNISGSAPAAFFQLKLP